MYTSNPTYGVNNGDGDSAWYALYTRHQHEKAVAGILSNKGFEIFLPLYAAVRHWKDRVKHLTLPLFPSYVFLRGGLDRRIQVVSTPGVFALVGHAGRPAPIPEVEINAVRKMVESSLRAEPHPFLKCGDRVRVKSGPLEGLEGILVRKKTLFRLVLSVEMLNQSAAVEVDASAVEPVSRRNGEPIYVPRLAGDATRASWAPSFAS